MFRVERGLVAGGAAAVGAGFVVEGVDEDEEAGGQDAADADPQEGGAPQAEGEVVDLDLGRVRGGEDEREGGEEGEEDAEVEGGVGRHEAYYRLREEHVHGPEEGDYQDELEARAQ